MARRLPVYILVDVSGSMSGEKIVAVENGVQTLVSALKNDPQALESAHLSVISFASNVEQLVPLTALDQFNMPQLTAGGMTSMGEALSFVKQCADKEVQKNTAETKGDWKPLVFLMTDGESTDNLDRGIAEFKTRKWGIVVACAAGVDANTAELSKITEAVVQLSTADTASFAAFFKWVSASIAAASASVGATNTEVTSINQLPPPPPEITLV